MSSKSNSANREILRLAIPNILSNVSVPLLSTVDTILMGHLSPLHLGAVGLGSMIFNFIYWNFGFLRMGTTGMTAQFFGAEDRKSVRDILGRSILIALLIAFAIVILQRPLGQLSIDLLQVDEAQHSMVLAYFHIRVWAAPASLCIYVLTGWLFGLQNSIYPLVITVAVNVVNIGLSYLFVMHLDMDIAGVAWSTVIAQYFGVLVCLILIVRKYAHYLQDWSWPALLQIAALKKFFQINVDLFIRTSCLTFAFAFFYSQSSTFGETLLAVNVILLQLVNWASYGIDGFAYAAESVVGKYHGARNRDTMNQMIRLTLAWGLVLGLSFSICYALFRSDLAGLFSDDTRVIEATSEFIWYAVLFPVVGFLCYIWDGIYIGLTASRSMRNTMIFALLIYLAIWYGIGDSAGNHTLWLALLVFLLMRGLIQTGWFVFKGGDIR